MIKEEEFQTLYILTCQKCYGKIRSLGKSQEDAWKLLVDSYVRIYGKAADDWKDQAAFDARMEETICSLLDGDEQENARKLFGRIDQPESQDKPVEAKILERISEEKLSEEKCASLWLEIEEKAGIDLAGQQTKNLTDRLGYSVFKVVVAVGVVIAAAALFMMGFHTAKSRRQEQLAEEAAAQSVSAAKESAEQKQELLRIEKEQRVIGWTLKDDGKLYYVNQEREEAKGALSLGGQVFVFSSRGDLTSIGDGNGVYNESTVYYIDNKDVYMREPGQEKVCIVLNGHVEKIGIANQNLYYICTYQVPNSQKVKTAVWKADLDGQNEELVFETMSSLKTERFQVSGSWYYYISDRDLFRYNWSNGQTEYMGQDMEHYFVWDDVVYYMDDGVIETVSEGEPYQDLSSYVLEPSGDSFVIKDASGQAVEGDENGILQIEDRVFQLDDGRITSVKAADQTYGDRTYFIRDSSKIYSSDSEGSARLLVQSGEKTDSFCIAGKWLYYSAYFGKDAFGQDDSRIYRMDLNSMEEEPVSQVFNGRVMNLYYSSNDGCIYGEYGPETGQTVHGKIICIPENGGMYLVDDTGYRPSGGSGGSEWLQFLSSDGEKIYCLWQDCTANPSLGTSVILETRPVILERSELIDINGR